MWKGIFLASKQAAQLSCSAGSIVRYVTGAAARLRGLETESEIYVFKWLGTLSGIKKSPGYAGDECRELPDEEMFTDHNLAGW